MASTRRDDRPAVLLMITVAGAVVGGVLASLLLTVDVRPLLVVLFVGTLLGASVAFGVLTTEPRRSLATPPARTPIPPAPQPSGNRAAAVEPAGRSPHTPSHVALPLPAPEAPADSRQWWNQTSPGGSGTRGRGGPAAGVSDRAPMSLTGYEPHRALIAQCPRCGDFHLDVTRAGPDYSFRCRNPSCANTWNWTPGTAWPAVVVRRNLTGGSAQRARYDRG